jgi:hypothetical protein
MANVRVKFDRAHFTARMAAGKNHCGPILAQQILDDSRPFTPHDQGTLEDSGRVEQIGEDYAATWNTVYAAYQWYGCWPDGSHVVRQHDTSINAQASTQWAEHAKDAHGKEWDEVFRREHARGASNNV